jgi:CO dehydrogenase/acetyl-CoA synthase beta subunit
MSLGIYDKTIAGILAMLEPFDGRKLPLDKGLSWPDAGKHNMVLRGDMAYELGGSELPAISGCGFTAGSGLVAADELMLYGPDLDEIKEDSPCARITIVGLDPEACDLEEDGNGLYDLLRSVEYERYHVEPEGFMMRISVSGSREPVRVARTALERGLTFTEAGKLFMGAYRNHPEVRAVKMIYITDPSFPFNELARKAEQLEQITASLDHIFHDLIMDCGSCSMREVCDEVGELRELHKKTISK